jgi:type I restriction enzyme R subunit
MADDRPIQVFDPLQEFAVVERRLPHWSQSGTITFITWRTWDSMPDHVIRMWLAERDEWLRENGINPSAILANATRAGEPHAEREEYNIEALPPEHRRRFRQYLSDRWNDHLDALHGECVLRRPELGAVVVESLRHFDGERYRLTDFVVMPNHVHLLAAFPDESAMLTQCESWKHYTAVKINRILGRVGRFWQQDGFDHLVRSDEQFSYLRRYIAENPSRAGLTSEQYVVYSSRSA